MPGCSGSLVFSIQYKTKVSFCAVSMLFHLLQRGGINGRCIFVGRVLLWKISGPCIK